MKNYIEFRHEQAEWTTGITFTNVSTNDRILEFDIITKDNFLYSGWYSYFLYNEDKTVLLNQGKMNMIKDETKQVYVRPVEQKIIYQRNEQ